MDATTTGLYVASAMVIAGLGMGLLQPVYTLAVQNVAPRERMGAATSSTIFFRSIGSTVGVAAFGSVMLTRYHSEFTRSIPESAPKFALSYFENPLLLMQVRPQLEQAFGRVPGGGALLQTLLIGVKAALLHGLQEIVLWSAVIMSLAILPHLLLKREPLRARAHVDTSAASAAQAH
jgi:hypothetical protein